MVSHPAAPPSAPVSTPDAPAGTPRPARRRAAAGSREPRERILRRDAVEPAVDEREARRRPAPTPATRPAATRPRVSREDHRDDAAGLRAESDPDGDLAGAARDAVRQHAVQADGRKRERDGAKRQRQLRGRAILRRQRRDPLFDRTGGHDRQSRVHALESSLRATGITSAASARGSNQECRAVRPRSAADLGRTK